MENDTITMIKNILGKYDIGKKPLSILLGWGETTISRYCDGDEPSKKYLDLLQKINLNADYYLNILEKNKNNITELAYRKSRIAVDALLENNNMDYYKNHLPMSGYVRVACDSINISVADVESNVVAIKNSIENAYENEVKVLVLNELCLTGYTCNDLFLQDLLLSNVESGLLNIAKYTIDKNMIVFVGAPLRKTGKLYNCAIAISNGTILGVIPKINIPNYNEFYELRHFVSGENIINQEIIIGNSSVPFGIDLLFQASDMRDFTIGCEICEDLWVANPPSSKLTEMGATIIVNLSASNEVIGKSEYRRNLVASQSARCGVAYVYASAGDGESTQDLVFSGHNLIAEDGAILNETELFENKMIYADVDINKLIHERQRRNTCVISAVNIPRVVKFDNQDRKYVIRRKYSQFPFVPQDLANRESRCKQILLMQANGLKKRVEHIHCKKIVVGLSGGLDSALAIVVAAKAMDLLNRDRTDIIAVTMPCFGTTKRTKSNAELLAEGLGTSFETIDISKSIRQHFADIGQSMEKLDVTFENGQARERTQVLMDIANKTGGIVLGTGDLSELALGWATYNGDHMSMYAVNASIPKTLVRYIVKYYADFCSEKKTAQALYDILDTPVSPELLPAKDGEISQKTEELVGPYELHDFFLYYIVRWGFNPEKVFALAVNTFMDKYDKSIIHKWLRNFYWRFFSQQFKRSCIPDAPKVGSVVLSPRGDWRMPSDATVNSWIKELEKLM